ncbi:MAG TPA: apolipoprotein N-acyltransferase, partial [Hyphomicrobiales bacterium]
MSLTDTRRILAPLSLAALSRALAGLKGWRRAAAAFTLGAASVLAFAPFHLWPLLFLILPCFIWMMDGIAESAPSRRRRLRAGAIAGWWFGFGFFAAGLYWIGYSFFVEADKFAWLVPLAVLAFPAAMALFYAAAGALAAAVWRHGAARIFILAAAFFAADWLRGHIFTGFPWNLWGYAIAGNDALAQTASIFGIYSLTLIALVMFMSPAALAGATLPGGARSWPLPALCLVLLAGGWVWGTVRLAGATNDVRPEVQLRIVQPNIPQADKWKPEKRQWIFDRLLELSHKPRDGEAGSGKTTDLIWPESSVPFLFLLNDF